MTQAGAATMREGPGLGVGDERLSLANPGAVRNMRHQRSSRGLATGAARRAPPAVPLGQ
jgi:hypothetical protein